MAKGRPLEDFKQVHVCLCGKSKCVYVCSSRNETGVSIMDVVER